MPDFTARFTAGATVKQWLDPPVPGGFFRAAGTISPEDPGDPPALFAPGVPFPNHLHGHMLFSRLNPRPGAPHLRLEAVQGVPVTFQATVAGVEGPMDAALGGRLFYAWIFERPDGSSLPGFVTPAGQSSVKTVVLGTPGHYGIGFGRHGGGGIVLMHVDVVPP